MTPQDPWFSAPLGWLWVTLTAIADTYQVRHRQPARWFTVDPWSKAILVYPGGRGGYPERWWRKPGSQAYTECLTLPWSGVGSSPTYDEMLDAMGLVHTP